MNRIALPVTLAAASLALFAGPAAASTTLGQVAPAPNPAGGCTTCSSIQISTAAGSPSYVIPPGGGIVTSWTFHAIGQAGTAQMRLLQPLPGNQYKLVAQSPSAHLRSTSWRPLPCTSPFRVVSTWASQ